MNCYLLTAAVSVLSLAGASVLAQTSAWTLDKNHTQVDFQIRGVPVSSREGERHGH
jgi:polyisoprenoid-binding protein YceI